MRLQRNMVASASLAKVLFGCTFGAQLGNQYLVLLFLSTRLNYKNDLKPGVNSNRSSVTSKVSSIVQTLFVDMVSRISARLSGNAGSSELKALIQYHVYTKGRAEGIWWGF